MLAPVGGYAVAKPAITHVAPAQAPNIRVMNPEEVPEKTAWSVSPSVIVGIMATSRCVGRMSSSRHSQRKRQPRGHCFVATPELSLQKAVGHTDKLSRAAWDHVIEASHEVSKKIEVNPVGGGDLSLEKYFQMPMKEFAQVPLCYGASMKPIGRHKSTLGTMEDYFECQVPELNFPGVMKIQCSTLAYIKSDGDKMVITGDKTLLRGMGKEMEVLFQENMRFRFDCVTSWADKDALAMKSNIKIEFDEIEPLKAVSPDIFRTMANPVTESVLRTLVGAFLDSFIDDYKKWAENESFRLERVAA